MQHRIPKIAQPTSNSTLAEFSEYSRYKLASLLIKKLPEQISTCIEGKNDIVDLHKETIIKKEIPRHIANHLFADGYKRLSQNDVAYRGKEPEHYERLALESRKAAGIEEVLAQSKEIPIDPAFEGEIMLQLGCFYSKIGAADIASEYLSKGSPKRRENSQIYGQFTQVISEKRTSAREKI